MGDAAERSYSSDTMILPSHIGLHGYAGSGKDEVYRVLSVFGYIRIAFGDAVKEETELLMDSRGGLEYRRMIHAAPDDV